jgi:predicted ATPase
MTKNQIIQTLLIDQRIPKEVNLKALLSEEVRPFQDKVLLDTSFYIQMANGRGKTWYTTLFLRDWLANEYPNGFELWNYKNLPSYVKMNVLERYIKNYNGFKDDLSYGAKLALEELKHAKLLIIDDFWISEGTDNFKGLVRESLFEILDWRSEKELQTIITTNLDLEKIGDIDANYARLASRIRGLCCRLKLPDNGDLRFQNTQSEITPKPELIL